MLKLNAGFSRKVGEPNYGSRGASVNVELELESGLVGDADGLMTRIRNLFSIAKRAVDLELNGTPASQDTANSQTNRQTNRQTNDSRNGHSNDSEPVRNATVSQLRAIRTICNRQGLDAAQLANERFQVDDLNELSLREASTLIDHLKTEPVNGRKAGVR